MRSNRLLILVFALAALFGSSNASAGCINVTKFSPSQKARLIKVGCDQIIEVRPIPPTVAPADADEARRAIGSSEQRKFVTPSPPNKSGGLIQFETPIKNKKIKTCS